jgi:hypothetical protein
MNCCSEEIMEILMSGIIGVARGAVLLGVHGAETVGLKI